MPINKEKTPDAKEVRDFHKNSDVDGSPKAYHHTLGPGANQAAPGNHTHDGGNSAQLETEVLPSYTAATLQNSWAQYNVLYDDAGYIKDRNRVYLRGMVKHAVTTTTGTIFTLPDGYRPLKNKIFHVPANGGFARVDVLPSGAVSVVSYIAPGNATWLDLDEIQFPTI